jgi:hypothetical protein
MSNIANEHLNINIPYPIEEEEVFANPPENEMSAEKGHDAEITSLFEVARDKLAKVKANSIKQKRQRVADLAKSREGKIPMDSVCMEIINHLRGLVSVTFIRQCLQEKYKQKRRVENAKKKHKQKPEPESKLDEKLATFPLLTLEDDDNKKKAMVAEIVGSGDHTLIDGNDEDSKDEQHLIY